MKQRITLQKQKILEYLRGVRTHPSAEMVYEEVKKEIPMITLATVYRNLNKLAEEGEILKLEFEKEARFDGHTETHQHAYCKKCGKIFDVFDDKISKYVSDKAKIKNFKIEQIQIIFYGICKECERRYKNGKSN